ncbi:hypothetical protein NDU88_002085 [Pleurodeles waltl]|uniref:Uncharacterized protein n=1 Tax=Pleurodeles waltl TaxID=8319 RepID=A0AAV7WNZ5_PLEWA|nr:hypothetical protein NDU88_002085 [Pleurodeles waltl]
MTYDAEGVINIRREDGRERSGEKKEEPRTRGSRSEEIAIGASEEERETTVTGEPTTERETAITRGPEEEKDTLLRERLDSCFRHTLDELERTELRQLVYQIQCHQRGLEVKTRRRVGVRSHFSPDNGT